MVLDFYASLPHYVDHMAPVFHALSKECRGYFYVPKGLYEYSRERHQINATIIYSSGPMPTGRPLLTAGYTDMVMANRQDRKRPMVLMEHGLGITPSRSSPG